MASFGTAEFTKWHELWQARLGKQVDGQASAQQVMQDSNPAIIPRNHQVESALVAAVERGDYSVMSQLLSVLKNPYTHSDEQVEYATLPTESKNPYQTYCGT